MAVGFYRSDSSSIDVSLVTGAPLQCLSLWEAEVEYAIEPEHHVVVATPYAQQLLQKIGFSATHLINFDYRFGSRRHQRYLSIKRMVNTVAAAVEGYHVDRLFLGTPGLPSCSLAQRVCPDRCYLLEDGSATLNLVGKYDVPLTLSARTRRLASQAVRMCYGLHSKAPHFTEVFTPLPISQHPLAPIRRNSFRRCGEHTVKLDRETVLLLGSYGIDESAMADDARTRRSLGEHVDLVYKPHPSNRSFKVPVGARLIEDTMMELPVELLILTGRLAVGGIVAYGSSALLSLSNLLPDEIFLEDLSPST